MIPRISSCYSKTATALNYKLPFSFTPSRCFTTPNSGIDALNQTPLQKFLKKNSDGFAGFGRILKIGFSPNAATFTALLT